MIQRNVLRLLSAFLICLLCFGLVSCNTENPSPEAESPQPSTEQTPENESDADDEKKVVSATYALGEVKDRIKVLGRTSMVGTGISCDFTASGIEFSAYMEGDVKLHLSCTETTYYSVYVDGVQLSERCLVNPTDSVITLASFEEGGVHTIRILKQTEAQYALSVLNALEMTGYWLDPPQEKKFYIEFIGDSISCGFGNLATSNIPSTEVLDNAQLYSDGTQSFAFLASEKLNADCSVVGCGGIGLVTTGYCPFVESEFYTKQSYFRSSSQEYTPERTPDLVVINLGTNDENYSVRDDQYIEKVKELIALVRETYGENVSIVWCYNMMNESKADALKTAIADLNGTYAGLYLCELSRNRNGGAGHPDVAGHITASEELVTLIQENRLLT